MRLSSRRMRVGLAAVAMVLTVLVSAPQVANVQAQTLPPRPTEPPAPTQPTSLPRRPGHGSSSQEKPGIVTGTLIDAASNAPAAGVGIQAGMAFTTTDDAGNYTLQLDPGTYTLMIMPGQGKLVEGPVTVTVESKQRVVQNLRYQRQQPRS